jgi:hypothetical protein
MTPIPTHKHKYIFEHFEVEINVYFCIQFLCVESSIKIAMGHCCLCVICSASWLNKNWHGIIWRKKKLLKFRLTLKMHLVYFTKNFFPWLMFQSRTVEILNLVIGYFSFSIFSNRNTLNVRLLKTFTIYFLYIVDCWALVKWNHTQVTDNLPPNCQIFWTEIRSKHSQHKSDKMDWADKAENQIKVTFQQ